MTKKRKGKSETILDGTDYQIMRILARNKKMTITQLKNWILLTHANLTTHLKRLSKIIERKRDKQTIYLSLTKEGKELLNLVERYAPSLEKGYSKLVRGVGKSSSRG